MGLAASQGRLLLLTARKSDLEYRAQEISQRRLILATELETVSSKYARATANRQMKITMKVKMGEANQTQTKNLTYKNLIEYGRNDDGTGNSIYRIKNSRGQVVVSDASELPKTASEAGYQGDGVTVKVEGNRAIVSGTDKNNNDVYVEYVVDSKISDSAETENYFQEGLRNGKFIIEQLTSLDPTGNQNLGENGEAVGTWNAVGWSGMSEIQDNYYTDDDATAQAEYQSASARVQAQDKKLETDQKQIETQHKAVETEFESVQKVIQSNIENSFKMFS